MKHSSRCNDRSSVGTVELFLVNLNDNGISERLVSGGWCLFWILWSFMLLNISLHDSWYFASFFFFYKSSLYSISFVDSTYIERNWHFVDSEIFFDKVLYPDFAKYIFIGGDLSASCLSSWQIKHFDQSALLLLSRQRKPNSFRHSNQ